MTDDPPSHRRSSVMAAMRSHRMSTLALCSCVLSMFFLLFSVFSYAGFMAMFLVPGLTHESAGKYAGLLSSAFMVGRALSSYPWGKLGDLYGRKFVLVASLVFSIVFSILFGLSTSFTAALAVRFFMGLGNGTMLIARTAVSELARGDRELESKGMGMVMSMVGYGMLISPAVGGALSEPLRQYPEARSWLGGRLEGPLSRFPFLLPNLIAALICGLSLVFVVVSVEETLANDKVRDWKYLVPDLVDYIRKGCCCGPSDEEEGTLPSSVSSLLRRGFPSRRSSANASHDAVANDSDAMSGGITLQDSGDDSAWEDLEIIEDDDCAELAILVTTPNSRASFNAALTRKSATSCLSSSEVKNEEEPARRSSQTKVKPKRESGAMPSFLSNPNTRDHLIAYWSACLVNVAANEAFPLFTMAKHGGLGWGEATIGAVGTCAGFLFCIGQYFIFSMLMKKFSLRTNIQLSSLLSNATLILFPFALWLQETQYKRKGVDDGSPREFWWPFAFLSLLMAVIMIFNSIFYACITIATNRTVDNSRRATLNGLSSLGASVGRGCGPIIAGLLVSTCLQINPSSGTSADRLYLGAILCYLVLTVMGLLSVFTTLRLEEEDLPDDKA